MKHLLLFALAILTLSGCQKELTTEEVANEYAPGVVAVVCKSYYTATLRSGMKIYFTGINSSGGMENRTLDRETILKKCDAVSASGTVAGADGKIIVPSSLFKSDADLQDFAASISIFLTKWKQNMRSYMDYGEYTIGDRMIADDLANPDAGTGMYVEDPPADRTRLEKERAKIAKDIMADNADLSAGSISVESVNEVAVAFNGETVKSADDLLDENPCTVLTKPADNGDGLAVIQLKSKSLPSAAKAIDLLQNSEDTDNQKYDIGQQLYMLCTTDGINGKSADQTVKVEATTGKLTAVPTESNVMYDFDKAEYCSGSPVFDTTGRLVGINITEKSDSGTRSYAIPLKKVQDILKKI